MGLVELLPRRCIATPIGKLSATQKRSPALYVFCSFFAGATDVIGNWGSPEVNRYDGPVR